MITAPVNWNWALITVLTGGVATLAIYSFLIKENPFYRFFEHLFIGIAAGFIPIFTIRDFLWPKIIEPLLGLNIVRYPDGTFSEDYNSWFLLYLFPMAFGLLYYFIFSKRHAWLAKLVIGLSLGVGGGIAFKGFFAEQIPQLKSSFKPLIVMEEGIINYLASFENLFFVFTLLAVMYYFFFTFKFTKQGTGSIAVSGRWLMMICFGSFFGSTVMARLALLVERIEFLIGAWWQALIGLFI